MFWKTAFFAPLLLCDEAATAYYQCHAEPFVRLDRLMKEDDGSQQTEDIAEANHRIGNAQRIVFYNIHPQYRACAEEYAAYGELPVEQRA